MFKLCVPFLEDLKKMTLIDPNCSLQSNCLDFQKLTTIHASSEEIATWMDRGNYSRIERFK
jgi:hypothetical protein